jgi:RNA polymerase sigma-70 factor (ECF subfamily)
MLALMAERPLHRDPAVVNAATSPRGEVAASGVPSADARSSALAARAAAGDRAALESLLRLHARDVATLCHHVAGAADAGDAAQESLERLVRELPRFDAARGSFRGWALTIARNVCRDRLRRRSLERGAFERDGDEQTARAEGGLPDPERLAIAQQGATSLARALEGLPEPMRAAVVMFHVGEASYEEIAQALEVPLGTVMTWLHRGRQRLRAAIEEP